MAPPARRAPPALLLDLDGTLLDVEMGPFLDAFFSLAAARFGGPGETRRIAQAMTDAARLMFGGDGERTLDRIFLDSFAPAVGLAPEEVRTRLDRFHHGEFERMRRLVRPVPAARALIDRALALGIELVLATNPVFFLDAILARARWAGLADVPFRLVTGAELMRRSKPHDAYYAQVLAAIGRRPEECLMAGDDPRMDMAAKRSGIATWLVVREGQVAREAPLADRTGTLEELTIWLG